MQYETSVSEKSTFHQLPVIIVVVLRPSPTLESVRSTLQSLQESMYQFRHIMGDSTQKHSDTIIKYGLAFSELDPRSKAAFSVLTITFELLEQQKESDQTVSDLIRQLKRVLRFADETLKEAVEDNTDILRKAIGRLYTLTMDVAEFSCDYVKRNRFKMLEKSVLATQEQEKINELACGLNEVVDDLDRVVNVETFKAIRATERVLLDRLKPVQCGYRLDRGCMEGTRVNLLDDIIEWTIRPQARGDTSKTLNCPNVYWLHGTPGIGKTAMAHSICARLHKEGRLGGTFFCRHDDLDLSDPTSVLPTLIFNLAETWGAYRKLIVDKLCKDPRLTRYSADERLLFRPLESLSSNPPHPLVLVVDALDECGDSPSRISILTSLIEASSRVNWLRIIITSRQDFDIESSFGRFEGRYIAKDLASDDNANDDIRSFARNKLLTVATRCGLPGDWPGNEKLDEIVDRSGGLFIFVETLSQLLEKELDPDQYLTRALSSQSGSPLERLYGLYTTAMRSQIDKNEEEFRSAMGTIIAVRQYQPLTDEAVAQLAGLPVNIVSALVNKLGSLLYRDAGTNGGIRVRHISVIDFLTGSNTPSDLRVNTDQANRDVAVGCLQVMTKELRFNICGIESSFMSNQDIADLQSRADQNMSAALQYSCVRWSDHLCHIPNTGDEEVITALKEFTKIPRLLYWMEALSVMGQVSNGYWLLEQVLVWLKSSELSVEQNIEDALRFIREYREPIMTSAPHTYISGLAFVPTSTYLWRHGKELFRNLLAVEKGRRESWLIQSSVLMGHTHTVCSVAYSPDGHRIVSGSCDNTIRIWDAETGTPIGGPLKGHTDRIRSVAYSKDGRRIASGSDDKTIRIWDAETGATVVGPLEGHSSVISCVAYSPDGRRIVSGSYDKTIRIWDAETGVAVKKPLKGHVDEISSVAYAPDGHRIVSGSRDQTISIWDAKTGATVVGPLKGHSYVISSVAYSPDGRRVVSGSYDKTIRIWDAKTGASVGEPIVGHTSPIYSVTYSPDGRQIVSGGYKIRFWDAETGIAVGKPLEGHVNQITSVAYAPDGRRIVSSSHDQTIRIWDAETGSAICGPLQEHNDILSSVKYPADDHTVISGSNDQAIQVQDPVRDLVTTSIVFRPDSTGWVRHPNGGLLFWVPDDYRNGLTCPAILTIPIAGRHRVVRLSPGEFSCGPSWTEIKKTDP
ncbi:hypothetical protein FRC20_006004 [Serendipita sp. 405]|nr:hypothetical protein FRC20_006004 [Serendipita sp. 405]